VKYLKKIKSIIEINEIINPYNFKECKSNYLNIFNIENISTQKYKNLLNQINLSNFISNKTKKDLVTMPINKSIFKKKINFTGMTEHLGKLNNKKTIMLMCGDNFSVIPYTTHINLKFLHRHIKKDKLKSFIELLLKYIKVESYNLNFKYIKYLCYNPHCGENETIGEEDSLITKTFMRYKKISGPFAADSAFKNIQKGSLYIAIYHDQGLIPFKTLNNLGFNLTLGLNYRRVSPDHGTAIDKKYKNISDNSSYLACMRI
jgi:4-hydroxythreonine-4-phosphate dehydrogenase